MENNASTIAAALLEADQSGSESAETCHLAVFSRAPVPGRTKTRLAKDIGPAAACLVHVLCLQQILAEGTQWLKAGQTSAEPNRSTACRQSKARRAAHLFITAPDSIQQFTWRGIQPDQCWNIHPQVGSSLNARMHNAICQLQGKHPYSNPVLLIGTDLPLLRVAHIEQATVNLKNHSLVVGPAFDGGYYLIGVNGLVPKWLFAPKPEQEGALETDIERLLYHAKQHNCSMGMIDALPDIDHIADIPDILAYSAEFKWVSPVTRLLTQFNRQR